MPDQKHNLFRQPQWTKAVRLARDALIESATCRWSSARCCGAWHALHDSDRIPVLDVDGVD